MAGGEAQAEAGRFAAALVDETLDALLAVTRDGTVQFWSRGAQQTFGFATEHAVGAHVTALFGSLEQEGALQRALEDAWRTGAARVEVRSWRKDKALVDVEVTLRLVVEPGREPFLALRARDMTPIRRLRARESGETSLRGLLESALRRLRDREAGEATFRGLLEAAPDALVIVGADGLITLVNGQTEKLFGYRREELIGKPVELLVPGRHREAHPDKRGAYFQEPRARPMGVGLDLHAVRKDGTEFPAEISLSPMHTDRGVLVTAAIRDISERRELEVKTQEASRLKSEFLANMSHELRTPLNAIIGFSELMHRGKVGPMAPQHVEYLSDILTSSRHLLQLINDILDLAKVESGKMKFRPSTVDIHRLVLEVKDIVRGLAATKHIRVEHELDDDVTTVVVDAPRVKQILYNYLSNSIKFTPDGGRIIVRITGDGPERFRIEVEDTGVGVATEDLPKLFVEFQQLDGSAGKRYQGTGLGLALTKRVAEAHGGHVDVKSEVGKGSVFSVVLPRVASVSASAGSVAEDGR